MSEVLVNFPDGSFMFCSYGIQELFGYFLQKLHMLHLWLVCLSYHMWIRFAKFKFNLL
jgi:hypothetical protein